MNKPTAHEITEAERTLSKLFCREYPEEVGSDADSAFNLGISNGFILALRGVLDNAFPRRNERR